ncbi:MAG: alpha/beta fold hydrolase [Azospirillaceae bacterium]|nr:alpha/beta fold hydrolase [Azospirillaceae bacterium]
MSDMTGTKATYLERWCQDAGLAFVRFDYQGHGATSGRFVDGGIGTWTQDALAVFDALTTGPQILVGSSMGAWIATLTAVARPDRIAGLIGVAAAPDFTEDVIWAGLDAAQRATLLSEGQVMPFSDEQSDGYPITRGLIEDGRNHLVLRQPIALRAPVRLLHGMADQDVPWRTSLALAERISGDDVRVTLIKDGEHRLSRDQDLAQIAAAVADIAG